MTETTQTEVYARKIAAPGRCQWGRLRR